MTDTYFADPPPLSPGDLKALWNDLTDAERDAYREDYGWAVIDSGRDAADHLFHELLKS